MHVKPSARAHAAAPHCGSHCHPLHVYLTLQFWRRRPITFNGVYGGEDHDARLEEAGWDIAPFPRAADAANAWQPAVKANGPGCTLRPQLQPPVKIREEMPAPEVFRISAGKYSYDFKQEFGGWPVLTVTGTAGSVIRLTPAELNDWAHGRANVSGGTPHQNFGPAYWQYTLRSNGTQEDYRPKFFTYGFRYLTVEIIAPGGGGGPSPSPSQPLPEGDAFVRCSDGKNPLCQGGKIFFFNAKAHARHHVPR